MCEIKSKIRKSYQGVLNQHFDSEVHQYIYWLTMLAIIAMTIGGFTINLWVSTESYIISTLIFSSVGFWLFTAYLSNNKHIKNIYLIPGSKVLLALVATGLVFYAKINTLSEINEVFSVDASALPNTTYIFTYINFISYFTYVFLAFVVYAGFKLVFFSSEPAKDTGEAGEAGEAGETVEAKASDKNNTTRLLALLVLTAAFASSMLLLNTITPITKDKSISIYRFALNYDFNDKSFCRQLNKDQQKYYAKLFLGPDQRRVLIARKTDTFMKDGKLNGKELDMYIKALPAIVLDCS